MFPAFPIMTVLALTIMIARKSEAHDRIYQEYPSLYIATFGFIFAKITCRLIVSMSTFYMHLQPSSYMYTVRVVFHLLFSSLFQVAHMCKSEFEYWDSIYFGPGLMFMNQYFDYLVPEKYVLLLAFVSIIQCHFDL